MSSVRGDDYGSEYRTQQPYHFTGQPLYFGRLLLLLLLHDVTASLQNDKVFSLSHAHTHTNTQIGTNIAEETPRLNPPTQSYPTCRETTAVVKIFWPPKHSVAPAVPFHMLEAGNTAWTPTATRTSTTTDTKKHFTAAQQHHTATPLHTYQ